MSYVDFEPLKPDPTTGDGTSVFTHTRENLLWLRDAAISGALMGWQLAVSGGTPAQPAQWLYSKGTERVRLTITWGASGGPKGKPQAMVVDYSSDSGTTWLTIGTATITYDAQGNFTGSTGIAPGLAAHWLMGLPERVRLIEAAVQGFGSMAAQQANSVNITGGKIEGITDLAVADGGTGAGNAEDARENLGANDASNLTKGTVAVERLGASGTRNATQVLRGDNTWGDTPIGPEEIYALSGTTPALDPANGTIQTWTLSANSAPTDALAAGESITLMINDGSARTITWPPMTWHTVSGAAPTLKTSGYTTIVLWKVGGTLYGAAVGVV